MIEELAPKKTQKDYLCFTTTDTLKDVLKSFVYNLLSIIIILHKILSTTAE